ncbi:MAG TPA: VOC family protein [Bdellovibrionales bacterium]|nr:VOC family protein [Bdellovibrionales bacterium]
MKTQPFTLCLWFDKEAEDAAKFYASIFKDGKIGDIHRYGPEGFEFHKRPEGSVMTVDFEVNGQKFQALNGGPEFKFNESVSIVITCEDQKEIDYYWEKLTAQGGQEVQCGWLKDKFGMSWQIVPKVFQQMLDSKNKAGASRAMNEMFKMKKFDIKRLEQAYQG